MAVNRKYSDELYSKIGLEPYFDEYSRQYKVRQKQDGYIYSMNHVSVFSAVNWIDKQIDYYLEKKIVDIS